MTWILFFILSFLAGSIPFSLILGKIFLRRDIRSYGDSNTGTVNVFRAGSNLLGFLTLLLDVSKAAVPVGLAYQDLGIKGIPIVLIAFAPVAGHAFSPFLGFRGGKAIAASLGVWIGLTLWKIPLAGVVASVVGLAITSVNAWAVMLGLVGMLAALIIYMPDPFLLFIWLAITLLLIWTHRVELRLRPQLRPWLIKRLSRSKLENKARL
jgi:glycerol-3-phosphate acyltransferase PlsY